MPTEAQHLEQRVAALQSDLNARDQALDDAATENNERELSRRSWFDEAQRLQALLADRDAEAAVWEKRACEEATKLHDAEIKLAERDVLLRRITGSDHQDSLRAIGEAAALSASAEPAPQVERDERADFEAWFNSKPAYVIDWHGADPHDHGKTMDAWEAWQARAALERKP
ncbi:hypothetical protein H7A76_08680 [Pseudomonas sp. MSSRFD41]|uniref:hypothetical protein n=1 Tax=Pseudomonas sp. MSSRFD41 TaxID=1310370 RepID=UPI00163B0B35|nr:hypothetical protein [Pseudomonas sp. MSSRFD41]MBC2655512.1 hypothetical protein [Pseudomonas sp. MSSRFD41]